ncbi:MAG: DUF2971 domain-containing protein [Aeromonas sobria]|uniref:DUF2971 domain-containing protein n=1 Tax=Aeromonas sobria TaxID=646 RepID=UPI003F40CC10
MNVLYKYIKNLGVDYFKNPKIKISNIKYLNDPFESEAGENLIETILGGLTREGGNYNRDDVAKTINEYLSSYGVFSVSETSRNPLMWAHYANEHRGICIGYKKNIFSKSARPDKEVNDLSEYTPRKVNYDNFRFDRQSEVYKPDGLMEAIKSHLLTKSDEWIYEKEHRCIVPLDSATHVRYNSDIKNTISCIDCNVSIDSFLAASLKSKEIIKTDDYEYKLTEKPEDITSIAGVFSSFECISMLHEIDRENIYSIHLGIRVSDEETIKYYNMINSKDSKLSHVKLYKFSLSKKRFELIPEVVDKEYIDKINPSELNN